MKDYINPNLKLGIIKGGQLGRMFIQEALNYNIDCYVMDSEEDSPCSTLATQFFLGDAANFQHVYEFGKQVDILTIEFEHINIEALEKLKQEGLPIYPDPSILKIIQDKGYQKLFFQENKIPTADFVLCENKKEIEEKLDFYPAVQKTRTAGYDGKGIYKIKTPQQIKNAFNTPSVLEKMVDIEKEISVIIARDHNGKTAIYPVIELIFHPEKNLVETLFAPARISKDQEKKAIKIAETIAEKLKIIGLLAVEMFVDTSGNILVNELAPRTHNSGHHTIEANYTSQFEQHLRAILNLPLGSTKALMPAVMVNLLGEENHEGPALYTGLSKALEHEGVFVHLYGKKITKPHRKMGHATILCKDIDEGLKLSEKIQKTIKIINE